PVRTNVPVSTPRRSPPPPRTGTRGALSSPARVDGSTPLPSDPRLLPFGRRRVVSPPHARRRGRHRGGDPGLVRRPSPRAGGREGGRAGRRAVRAQRGAAGSARLEDPEADWADRAAGAD